jgi:hypothetical protein
MGSSAAIFALWLLKKISRSRIFIERAGLQASRGQRLVGRSAKKLVQRIRIF